MPILKLSFCAAFLAACSTAWAGKWAPVPVEALGQSADLVVLATVANALPNSAGGPAVQLTVESWISGQPGAAALVAALPPSSPNGPNPSLFLTSLIGRRGIWLVTRVASGTGYQLLSMISGAYGPTDLFLSVSASVSPQQFTGTLNQQLLAYLVNSYQSLAQPTPVDTTGAGDAFIGSFACFLGSGYEESEALARANVYAALSTLSAGTQMSFVTAERFEAAWAGR